MTEKDDRPDASVPSGQPLQPLPLKPERTGGGFWTWLLTFVLVLVLVLAWGGRAAIDGTKHWYGQRKALQALDYLKKGDVSKAHGLVVEASQYAPDQPDVVRASAEFLIQIKQDPRNVAVLLSKLRTEGVATVSDLLKLGRAELELGDRAAAKEVYADIPEIDRDRREPLELLAAIYRSEGKLAESERALRKALEMEPDDPECLLRLSMLDYGNTFPEIHRRARERLWLIAKGEDATALQAIHFLAEDKDLSAKEAEELLKVVVDHPSHTEAHRLEVVSATIRAAPQTRDAIMDREIAAVKSKGPLEMLPVLRWLHEEKQFARILKAVPVNIAVKSRELFPIVAQALGEESRWADLKRLITSAQSLPVSRARMNAWLAEAETHLNPDDVASVQQLIVQSIIGAEQSRDYGALMAAAVVAEKSGNWSLAARAARTIADADPRLQLPMLEKVLEMRTRDRDSAGILSAASELAELRPGNTVYESRLNYVRLVTGQEMEIAAAGIDKLEGSGAAGSPPGQVPTALLRALEAYRFGDLQRVAAELQAVPDAGRLDAGLRAVHAGLLSLTGQVGRAYGMAEQIPSVLLLDEEAAFLARAR
ncbi:MAG: hypothetical protein KDK97_08765 [Verrucomicrobiales bacterium]|nr:hypothetical protein [Verrucomicrobiales bacterium]MCP5559040.1 hypothetical protein [Verrucomicrobiaceae bacterium]